MHVVEQSAGAQLAIITAVKLLLSVHYGNLAVVSALEDEMARARVKLHASRPSERKLQGFDDAAAALLDAVRPR
jgi:ATP-dependent Clp protease adapter protein ClpS